MSVDWELQAEYVRQLEAAGPLVRQAEEHMRLAWNELLFELARLLNIEGGYQGETADELVALLRAELEALRDDRYDAGGRSELASLQALLEEQYGVPDGLSVTDGIAWLAKR